MPTRSSFPDDRMPPSMADQLAGTMLAPEPQQASSPATRAADRRRALDWYLDHTGTAHECARALGALPTTILPRVTDLRNHLCLVPVPGVRRATGSGGTAAVLMITAIGRKELAG